MLCTVTLTTTCTLPSLQKTAQCIVLALRAWSQRSCLSCLGGCHQWMAEVHYTSRTNGFLRPCWFALISMNPCILSLKNISSIIWVIFETISARSIYIVFHSEALYDPKTWIAILGDYVLHLFISSVFLIFIGSYSTVGQYLYRCRVS